MVTEVLLKLQIEMVPISAWGSNLRSRISKSRWDKLRKQVHARNGLKCEICGSPEQLHCHEHWDFDETTQVQKLAGLGTICHMCHHVAHFGRAKQLASQGHIDIQAVVNHFMKVNGCDEHTFMKHEQDALALFTRRSQYDWRPDFGEYVDFFRKDAG